MNCKTLFLAALGAVLLFGCSGEGPETTRNAYVSGNIIVDPELDSSGDYSGITIISIVSNDGTQSDTLFYAVTDSSGYFEGRATFDTDEIYPILVTRNRNTFGIFNVVFADGDTIRMDASLPDVNQTITIASRENNLFDTLDRIERNFNRVASFINAGAVSADSIHIEIEKWSNIYWELFDDYPGTYVAKVSGENSAAILRGWNDSLMVARSKELLDRYNHLSAGVRQILAEYYAESEGLHRVIEFYSDLENRFENTSSLMQLKMERIELLYDSSRTVEANQHLQRFKDTYAENQNAMEWAENISYDLEFLAPGYPFPDLSFISVEGDSLTIAGLKGKPILLEITRFDNAMYQQQYDRTVAIYQIYRNFDLEIITVPVSTSEVMLRAFFDERTKLWNIVQPNSFDASELIELLNLNRVPTRFLIDRDGTIIRRYIGNEYDDIVSGLQRITTINESQQQ